MAETKKPLPNLHLRYERERRGWSQQEVADKVGTTPLNVSRWERGETIPGPHFRAKLSEVFEKSPYDLGLVAERPPAPPPSEPSLVPDKSTIVAEPRAPLWNVPYGRNAFFTGREQVLERLRTALSGQIQPIAISQPQAISGLGGIGKTQLSVEYAYRYRDDYSAVLWARAESADLLVSDYLTIAALLELTERNEQEQRKIVNAVLRWFDTHQGWLLILDNADQLEMAREFIPTSGNGHMLLTTRAFSTGTIAERIELETMTLEEGTLFLLRRIKRIRGNTSLDSISESIWSQARAIVEAMDALPLALDQAGAYIEETGTNLADYLKLYRTRRQRLLRIRGQDTVGHPEPVATTWSLSVEKIKQANLAAAELLYLLALLHPDNIPESMLIEGASKLGPVLEPVVSDPLDFNEALGELHKYSLIKRDPEEKILAIHRLVQAVIWDGMKEQEREQWIERSVAALDAIFPDVTHNVALEIWGQCERLLPHVLACMTMIASQKCNQLLASLLYKAATYLRERAQYEQAEFLYLRALQAREQALGLDHPDVATSLNGLAGLYYWQGKYEQAEPLFRRALQILEQALGPAHSRVAHPLNNLAILYQLQGKYQQAEPLFRRAIQIWEQALGPTHIRVAYPLNNLAIFYSEQGKYEEAEPLYQRSLQIFEQELGLEHPLVASPLDGLATLYRKQGKYEQAEPLFRRALQIWEQALGPQHPDVAYPLNGLAELCYLQGKYEQAELLYRRALHIYEQALGLEHLLVANSLQGLATLYREQGKYEQAELLYQRALTIRQLQGGAQHLETAETLHDFARLHEVQNQPEEAISLYLQALAIREQQLGPEHPRTVETRTRAARLLRESGQIEEATALEAGHSQQVTTSDKPAR